MDPNPDYRILTLPDVNQAAQVISQAFENDPLCTIMLPPEARECRQDLSVPFSRWRTPSGPSCTLTL